MSKYVIYKATNKENGKSYVGFDSNWPKRQRDHKRAATEYVFHQAIRKYGWDAFEWEILYESGDHEYTLNEMEEYFIRFYKSHMSENGYNMTYGGEGTLGWNPSEETRSKISESNKGRACWNKGGKAPWTSEYNTRTKKGVSKPNKRNTYRLYDPGGNEYITDDIKTFATTHGLHWGDLTRVSRGTSLDHHKLWFCQVLNKKTGEWTPTRPDKVVDRRKVGSHLGKHNREYYVIESPDGKKHNVYGLKPWCMNNFKKSPGSAQKYLFEVAKGKRESYKGWKCRKVEE